MNTQSTNPTAIGSRTKIGRQSDMRSTSLTTRSFPRTSADKAATSITVARNRNAPGADETGAENQSSAASRRRTATTPATPVPPRTPRATAMSLQRMENAEQEQGPQQRRENRENVSEDKGHRIVSRTGIVGS